MWLNAARAAAEAQWANRKWGYAGDAQSQIAAGDAVVRARDHAADVANSVAIERMGQTMYNRTRKG